MREKTVSLVKLHEGFNEKLYKCTEDKLTIGYGFNLEAIKMPEKVGAMWLELILDDLEAQLKKHIIFYDVLSDARKTVLLDMAYNLGIAGLLQFKKMLLAMQQKKFTQAADEMLASKWAQQVKSRAYRLSEMMRRGEYDVR